MEDNKQRKRVRPGKVLYSVLKATHLFPILIGFIIYYFVMTTIIYFVARAPELSNISNYGDAMWFTFASIFTIGYGDIWVSSVLGRILTVLLVIYGVFIIALIPAITVAYIQEVFNRRKEMTSSMFLEQLTSLDTLSKDELKELSNKVKEYQSKRN